MSTGSVTLICLLNFQGLQRKRERTREESLTGTDKYGQRHVL